MLGASASFLLKSLRIAQFYSSYSSFSSLFVYIFGSCSAQILFRRIHDSDHRLRCAILKTHVFHQRTSCWFSVANFVNFFISWQKLWNKINVNEMEAKIYQYSDIRRSRVETFTLLFCMGRMWIRCEEPYLWSPTMSLIKQIFWLLMFTENQFKNTF